MRAVLPFSVSSDTAAMNPVKTAMNPAVNRTGIVEFSYITTFTPGDAAPASGISVQDAALCVAWSEGFDAENDVRYVVVYRWVRGARLHDPFTRRNLSGDQYVDVKL